MEAALKNMPQDSPAVSFDENDDFLTLTQSSSSTQFVREEALFSSHPFRETIFSSEKEIHQPILELKFSSNFECANLHRVDRIHFPSCRADDALHYALWMHRDSSVLHGTQAATQWFYFLVSGLQPNVSYRLHIVNFCKSKSLLSFGMRPVISDADAQSNDSPDVISTKRRVWRRFGSHVAYRPSHELSFLSDEEARGYSTFSFTVTLPHEANIYIALTHPYSYFDLQHSLGLLKSANIRREILCQSPQGRRVDIIIATENGQEELLQECDSAIGEAKDKVPLKIIEECDTEDTENDATSKGGGANCMRRRYKPVLFFCARSVGGDAPASFAAEGLIQWLASSDLIVRTLLQHFVIICVPLLNPDGCALGNARTDAAGRDLADAWMRPDRVREPSIYFCKRYLRKLLLDGRLAACVEIKAHSRQIGSFFYGVRSQIDRAAGNSAKKGATTPSNKSTIDSTTRRSEKKHKAPPNEQPHGEQHNSILPALISNPPHWDFFLAFMRRSPFLMDHRACSFENLDLLCPPVSLDASSFRNVHAKQWESAPPLSLRQALHRLRGCPSLNFTFYMSIFRGNKGPQGRRHLHPGDYRKAGCSLLLALAETLGVVLHRSNRESYIALSKHDSVGGSIAEHADIDRDFAVLERALRMGKGGLSGRHESFHIAQAVQLRGNITKIDDDLCCDLDNWEMQTGKHRAFLRTMGWSESESLNASDSPISDDEEIALNVKEKSAPSVKIAAAEDAVGANVVRKFCFRCEIFGHELSESVCPHYVPPAPPKKRIDEEYVITDDFYHRVINRYLRSAADETTTAFRESSWVPRDDKGPKLFTFPKLGTLLADNEILWLATHFPAENHIGGMRSRKLEDQANSIAAQYRDFKRSNCDADIRESSCETVPQNVNERIQLSKVPNAAVDGRRKSQAFADVEEAVPCKAPKPPQSGPPSLRSVRLKGENVIIPRFIIREAASLRDQPAERPCIIVPNSARRKKLSAAEK